jgi:hypothetical protein
LYRVEKIKWLKPERLRRIQFFSEPVRNRHAEAKGGKERKELEEERPEVEDKTSLVAHARRRARARRPVGGCDGEVCGVIRK